MLFHSPEFIFLFLPVVLAAFAVSIPQIILPIAISFYMFTQIGFPY